MQTESVADKLFAQWREEGRDEGRKEGQHLGEQRALVRLYVDRFQRVPPEIEAAIAAETDEATLLGWVSLFATGSAEAIAAALLRRP